MNPADDSPARLTAIQALALMRAGSLSAEALVEACAARIESREPALHAWVHWSREQALVRARAIDQARNEGRELGRLAGVPIGVKDVFNTCDFPTEMGSPIWKGFTPGNDARVVHALREDGAVVMGKTVAAEFAVHHPGDTVNPHHPDYSPGTSSSGSAAAVAAHMVPLALGTQTAGSTIRPASYCGIYGFKPTFGVVPRTGTLKTLDTLDHVSFFARSAADLDVIFESGRVRGPNHPFVHRTLDQWRPGQAPSRLRVAFVRGPVWGHAEQYAQRAIETLAHGIAQSNLATVEEITLPEVFSTAHAIHECVYDKALSYYFRDEFREHSALVSDRFKAICERGERVSLESYREGLAQQRVIQHALDGFFEQFDIILGLSTSGHAPYGRFGDDRPDNSLIWTLCHAPAVSVPVFTSPEGLPFGAQFVARRYHDRMLLEAVGRFVDAGVVSEWSRLHSPDAAA